MKNYIKFIISAMNLKKSTICMACIVCMFSACLHTGTNLILLPLIDNSMIEGVGLNWEYTVEFILLILLNALFKYIRRLGINALSINSELFLTEKAVKGLSKKDMAFFDSNGEGKLTLLLSNRIKNYRIFLMDNLENFLYEPFDFLFTFLAVCYVDFKVAVIVFAVIIISAVGNFMLSDRMVQSSEMAYDSENEVRNYQKEIVENYDNIFMAGLNKHVIAEHQKKVLNMLEKDNRLTKECQRAYVPALLNEYLPTIIFLLIVVIEVLQGTMTYGEFASLLALISGVSLPVTYYLRSFTRLKEQIPFMCEIEEMCFGKDEIEEHSEKIDVDAVEEMVVFEDVNFSYENRTVFSNNLNFIVKKGEKVALVGESGTGKTTILKLIMGGYMPDVGKVKVFGVEAFKNKNSIWREIAYVDNENYLFNASIKYNITLKESELNETELERYRKICDMLHISEIENREENVEQFGRNLSGGQRLRISLARALYRNAELLILDEPVASFDSETEKIVIDLLQEIKVTVIFTTHRTGLLDVCSKILHVSSDGMEIYAGERVNEYDEKSYV